MRLQLVIATALLMIASNSRGNEVHRSASDDVKAAEAMRIDIDAAVAGGTFRSKAKEFGWRAPECEIKGFPILNRTIAMDASNRIRIYDRSQRVSHGATERVRSYFDETGQLRVVERRELFTVDVVYLNESGRVVHSATSGDRGATWRDLEVDVNDWFMKPRTPADVEAQFEKEEPSCRPEVEQPKAARLGLSDGPGPTEHTLDGNSDLDSR